MCAKILTTLIDQGKSADEVVAARPFADLQAQWNEDDRAMETFTRRIYNELNGPRV